MKLITLFLSFLFAFSGYTIAQPNKEVSNPYAEMGQTAVLEGNFKLAASHLEKAAVADANNGDIHFTLGYSYFHSGEYAKAIGSLSKAVSLKPERANAYYYRGKARNILATQMNSILSPLEKEKLLQAGIRDFSKCIEINAEQNMEYYQNRAMAYFDYGILKEQKVGGTYDKVASELAYKSSINDLQHILDVNPSRKDIADVMKKARVYLANLNN
jgi:tetratricopeptide (TPR) repeat protein